MDGWIAVPNGYVRVVDSDTIRCIEVNASGTHYEVWVRGRRGAQLIGTAPTAVRAAALHE